MPKCGICDENEFKYKCPKCGIRYCSLVCFKSEKHIHEQTPEKESEPQENSSLNLDSMVNQSTYSNGGAEEQQDADTAKVTDPTVLKLLKMPKFQQLLNEPVVQLNLNVLYEILNDVSTTNEYNTEGRYEIVNKKLTNLRSGGLEENKIFDEFCEFILNTIQ